MSSSFISPSWQEVWLSPIAEKKSSAPDALKLTESEDEISPISLLSPPRHFSFSTPKASRNNHDNDNWQLGQLSKSGLLKRHKVAAVAVSSLIWFWGCVAWISLLQASTDPIVIVPPPTSPSSVARAAFDKVYKRDWGAHPSLWVVLEASDSRRSSAPTLNSQGEVESHSFADDTSLIYEQGKHFSYDLAYDLESQFHVNGTPSVKITSYYSLQEQGLDYVARNLVTPDGSKTLVQIQYIQDEIGGSGVLKLKQKILRFGQQNQPSYLNIHYTGMHWNPSLNMTNTQLSLICAAVVLLLEAVLFMGIGVGNQSALWGVLILASMATTMSLSSLALNYLTTTTVSPLSLSSMAMVCLVLSVYYSKFSLDNIGFNGASGTILRSGGILMASFASLYTVTASPVLQSVSVATTTVVTICTAFHALIAPRLLDDNSTDRVDCMGATQPQLQEDSELKPSQWSNLRKLVPLCMSTLLLLSMSSRAPSVLTSISLDSPNPTRFLVGDSQNHFYLTGETVGHGRLTPYRLLFDGTGPDRNQSMISLAGYDIQQMVLGELEGISLDGNEPSQKPPGLEDFTPIGEQYKEVQHLIKQLVSTLRRFKEEQQRQFDLYHKKRQDLWTQIEMQEESDLEDIRCEFPVNAGIETTTYSGIAVLDNLRIPQSLYNAANICRGMEPRCPSEALHLLNVIEDETTPSHHLATYISAILGVNPLSREGNQWLILARETIERLQEDPRVLGGVKVFIDSPAGRWYDFQKFQVEILPRQLLTVVGVVVVSLLVALQSFGSPLRIFMTASLTTAAAIGMGSWLERSGSMDSTVVLACILAVTSTLVSEVGRFQQHNAPNALTVDPVLSSTRVISACFLVLSFGTSVAAKQLVVWPLLVVAALLFDAMWLQGLALPFVSTLGWSKSSRKNLRSKRSDLSYDNMDPDEDNAVKFDKFILSPQAP
ncbi:expressed unknown protein [Seminavis robusta]|uniref:Uncharacterized protein n=1 Tax=Seminavis robusta TaxID=568900 RepID=A0A9N8ETX7_9STRA|nr:expressed unknown protein [Seminavis robusta]|eukprot:Sro1617_g286330.1 n/a (942) ;mRNA; r:15516-18341